MRVLDGMMSPAERGERGRLRLLRRERALRGQHRNAEAERRNHRRSSMRDASGAGAYPAFPARSPRGTAAVPRSTRCSSAWCPRRPADRSGDTRPRGGEGGPIRDRRTTTSRSSFRSRARSRSRTATRAATRRGARRTRARVPARPRCRRHCRWPADRARNPGARRPWRNLRCAALQSRRS